MQVKTLLEVLSAAHLSAFVDSKFKSRGGMMLVAPPASLKSAIIKKLEAFPGCMVLSDLNTHQILRIRDDVAEKLYHTIALTEFEKLRQRHRATADNVEGHLRAMCEEGFGHGAFEDQRMVVRIARCLVVAAMTQKLYSRRYTEWRDDGFMRRFIWCHYVLKDAKAVMRSIHNWQPLELGNHLVYSLPPGRAIPFDVTNQESARILRMLDFQEHAETPFILLKKIAAVLKWRNKKTAFEILDDFSECLTKDGAELEL